MAFEFAPGVRRGLNGYIRANKVQPLDRPWRRRETLMDDVTKRFTNKLQNVCVQAQMLRVLFVLHRLRVARMFTALPSRAVMNFLWGGGAIAPTALPLSLHR